MVNRYIRETTRLLIKLTHVCRAAGLKDGLSLTSDLGISQLENQFDSLVVVNLLNSNNGINAFLSPLFDSSKK